MRSLRFALIAGVEADICSRFHQPGLTGGVDRLTRRLVPERSRWSESGLACIAFSQNLNLMLKHLTETGVESPFDIGVSVSAPIDTDITSKKLQTGSNRLFGKYLLHNQRSELLGDNENLSQAQS